MPTSLSVGVDLGRNGWDQREGAKPSLSGLVGGIDHYYAPRVKKAPGTMADHKQHHTHWPTASYLKDHRTCA